MGASHPKEISPISWRPKASLTPSKRPIFKDMGVLQVAGGAGTKACVHHKVVSSCQNPLIANSNHTQYYRSAQIALLSSNRIASNATVLNLSHVTHNILIESFQTEPPAVSKTMPKPLLFCRIGVMEDMACVCSAIISVMGGTRMLQCRGEGKVSKGSRVKFGRSGNIMVVVYHGYCDTVARG